MSPRRGWGRIILGILLGGLLGVIGGLVLGLAVQSSGSVQQHQSGESPLLGFVAFVLSVLAGMAFGGWFAARR